MARALYLVSPRSFSGKSMLTLALAKDVQARGNVVHYFKPTGPYPVRAEGVLTDQDALFMADVLGLQTPPAQLCPVPLTDELHRKVLAGEAGDLLPMVKTAYDQVSAGADLVLVGGIGGMFTAGTALGLAAWQVAGALEAGTLVITGYEPERSVDELLAAQHLLGDRMLGAIFNAVRPVYRQQLESDVIPFLTRRGVTVFGSVPDDPVIHSISIAELVDGLNARVLVGEEHGDELVERFVIGAMHEEAALSHFRRLVNKGVVTGGDRSDLQRAALETSTKVLVLTGGIYPTNIILSAADEKRVPVLLVQDDTLTTIERIETMLGHLRVRQPRKIERAVELVRQHVDLDRLWAAAGV
jgi:BioD-like phosphotransacetylase family protein